MSGSQRIRRVSTRTEAQLEEVATGPPEVDDQVVVV